MAIVPENSCRLCQAVASALDEPVIMCFDPDDAIKYTAAEVLNKHFWFEVRVDNFFYIICAFN